MLKTSLAELFELKEYQTAEQSAERERKMKNACIRKIMTAALAVLCMTSAVPASAWAAPMEETVLSAGEDAEETVAQAGDPAAEGTVFAESAEQAITEAGSGIAVPEQAEAGAEESFAAASQPEAGTEDISVTAQQTESETEEVFVAAEQPEPETGDDSGMAVQPEEETAEVSTVTEQPEEDQTEPAVSADTPDKADTTDEADTPDKTVAAGENSSESRDPSGTAEDAADDAEAEEVEPEEELEQEPEELGIPVVSYQTHVQTFGWQDYVTDGVMSGTEGKAKRLEGIRIKVDGVEDLGIEYCTHVQTYGWQKYVADDQTAGTTGEAKRLEAIRIRLTGSAASDYNVYYCVHVQSYGWLNWAKNDEMAGTAGYAKRLEGIRIVVLPKDEPAPVPVSGAVASFISNDGSSTIGSNDYKLLYNTHVQTYGWQDWVGDGMTAGTSGQSKRLEGMHILLQDQEVSGSIQYRTHVQGIGWQDWVSDGAMAGTSGQAKRLEALQIRLTGEMANRYDVWYRTHVQHFGWRGWAKNGEEAGSEGYAYRMEAIEIKLLPKGSAAPGSTENAFSKWDIRDEYPLACARLDLIGWDLRNAFIWSASMPYYRLPQDISYGARFFATYGFENGRGDCYVMAACFYEMAKALGYDAHWMFGYVPMAAGGLGIHSWVEIDIDGATYVCDPDYTHESGGNGYMFAYGYSGWGYYSATRMN